ncbi:MAG: hypothetical protein Q9190_002292 [Brigantiaea leucoxantha]
MLSYEIDWDPGPDISAGPTILIVTWTLTSVAVVVVALKVWTRIRLIHLTGADDVLTVIALVFVLVYASIITVAVHAGLGRHLIYIEPENLTRAIKLAIIANPFVIIASALPNVAVAIALNRILIPVYWQLTILYGIPILQCIIALISSILAFTYCNPPSSLWDPTQPAKCISTDAAVGVLYFNGGKSFGLLTDPSMQG